MIFHFEFSPAVPQPENAAATMLLRLCAFLTAFPLTCALHLSVAWRAVAFLRCRIQDRGQSAIQATS